MYVKYNNTYNILHLHKPIYTINANYERSTQHNKNSIFFYNLNFPNIIVPLLQFSFIKIDESPLMVFNCFRSTIP